MNPSAPLLIRRRPGGGIAKEIDAKKDNLNRGDHESIRYSTVLGLGMCLLRCVPRIPEGAQPSLPAPWDRLADSSSVRMALTQPLVEIDTKYSKLAVPVNGARVGIRLLSEGRENHRADFSVRRRQLQA